MENYTAVVNPHTGKLQLVHTDEYIQSLLVGGGLTLDQVKADTDIADAISKKHSNSLDHASGSDNQVLPTGDGLTIIDNAGVLKVADRIENNIILLAFLRAVDQGKIKYNMNDGFIDEYEDESGIDTANSENQNYDSSSDFYEPLIADNQEVDYMEYASDEVATQNYISSAASIPGNDQYTKLLLHADGPNASKEILDSGNTGHIITKNGNATIINRSYLGVGSAYFDGTNDSLHLADSDDWSFGAEDFTVEFFANFSRTNDAIAYFIGQNADENNRWQMVYASGTGLQMAFKIGGSMVGYMATTANWIPETNVWYHIAFVRNGTSGAIYVNGISQALTKTGGSYTDFGSNNLGNVAEELKIGQQSDTGFFQGYIDELRISKGIARYTANFTPTITEFEYDSYTKLLLHFNEDFVDSCTSPKTVDVYGTLIKNSKFDKQCLYLDGTGDYLTIPDSSDWDIGTDNFCIDFWLNRIDITNANTVFQTGSYAAGKGIAFYMLASNSGIRIYLNGSGTSYDFTWTASVDTWYHIALTRSSNELRLFINGTQVGVTRTDSTNIDAGTNGVQIGALDAAQSYYGRLKEFRISRGTARWTANFSVPTSKYISDSYTKLLLHFNTLDNSIVSSDMTFVNTVLSTSAKKFGSSSFYFNGSSSIAIPSSPDFNFSNLNFTIDFWIKFDTAAQSHTFFWRGADVNNCIFFYWYQPQRLFYFDVKSGGTTTLSFDNVDAWTPNSDTWYHIAIVRKGTGDTDWALYIDGVAQTIHKNSGNWNISLPDLTAPVYIGVNAVTSDLWLKGYLDELRISKGIARYTANFTPNVKAYESLGSLAVYSEDTIKNQGSHSLKLIAEASNSLNETITKTLTGENKIDLSDHKSIKFDVYSLRTGQNIQVLMHDSGGTTSTYNITINSASTWETKTWDISAIAKADKDDIDSIIFKVVNADAEDTFYIDNIYATRPTLPMTLASNAVVAEAEPSQARIVIFEEDIDSATINTDLKAYVSIDNGANYDQVTLTDEGDYDTAKRILSGIVDVSARTGTNMKYKLTTHNEKDLKIHGIGMSWL